ncbi:hypothetical protein GCWU000323_02527 [Leptotrichia hofstadii F0254]|uniref:Uncharacterized protein n=1 Tax=Leptotrichia hofstadii F0254 TaxID=634994 RepID=C9N106_9FUSO|nr:hypothetical protein GCWU000323_02527 [Leptotrichia hofstadii F0254]
MALELYCYKNLYFIRRILMKKIVTIIAGLTISLSLISETKTDSGIVYVKK